MDMSDFVMNFWWLFVMLGLVVFGIFLGIMIYCLDRKVQCCPKTSSHPYGEESCMNAESSFFTGDYSSYTENNQ